MRFNVWCLIQQLFQSATIFSWIVALLCTSFFVFQFKVQAFQAPSILPIFFRFHLLPLSLANRSSLSFQQSSQFPGCRVWQGGAAKSNDIRGASFGQRNTVPAHYSENRIESSSYGLVHVAAGDLLRAEITSGSENGRRAREYMEQGKLVPDEIVVMMVKDRLMQPDSQEKCWLLDGYPRSSSQAIALKELGFKPDLFVLVEVPEDILVETVVGRRLDPITGKVYHLKYSPPETQEIASRLTQRFDDTEEKCITKEDVFAEINSALTRLVEKRKATSESLAA